MIPPLDSVTGHLPLGRYPATLNEIHDRFVEDARFSQSSTRSSLWEGFERYLATWRGAEHKLGALGLLHRVWMAGSFVSSKIDPEDIDLTVFRNDIQFEATRGMEGRGLVKDLTSDRSRVRRQFGVEAFLVPWRPITAILDLGRLSSEERDYLLQRAAQDDLWERKRPEGPKGRLRAEHAAAARGYLEVIL